MADLDEKLNRLSVKIVYYGPALSGKTTNLTRLHDLLDPELKGAMMTLDTDGDRTLFFDLLPFGFTAPSGLLVKFKLFTVPGQVIHDGTRKAVLSRADGVVFVADSQRHQEINNAAAFDNLMANAAITGLDPETMPLVVQFNKRDLPASQILAEDDLRERWAQAPWPLYFAAALEGTGVVATFRGLLGSVYERLDTHFALASRHGLTRDGFLASVGKQQ
jgi:signal recognition particle receptor subunit beta